MLEALEGLRLVDPVHMRLVSNGCGEFPNGYELTPAGIQLILSALSAKV